MQIGAGIGDEAVFLGIAILVGAVLFFLYDMLRIFRRIVPHGVIWVGVEDFFYWLICTFAVFLMLYQKNDGMVRGFAIGGVVIGMLLYILLLSRFVIRIHVFVLKKVLFVLKKIILFLFGPIYKIGKKILGFCMKQLKKLWKAVRISLCKL